MSKYGKFSPIAKLKEKGKYPPYERDTEQWEKFFDEQQYYFKNGYQVGGEKITGEMYWQLNFCHMGITDARGNKVPTLPFNADWLNEAYNTYAECKKTGENIIHLKGRDKGHTYWVSALALFQTQNEEFSDTLVLFPGGTSTAKANFRKAYNMAYNELDIDFKSPTLKNTEGKSTEEIFYGFEVAEIDKKTGKSTGVKSIKGNQSKLTSIVAVSPDVVRSGRSKLVIVEESGEINQLRAIVGVAEANMREGNKKFGVLIAGGTSNCFNDGFEDFKYIWHNPEDFNFRKIFTPANKFYLPFVDLETGKSDLEKAKEELLKIRSTKKGKDLIINKQEYPLTEEEAFFEGTKSVYDVELCNKQINRIISDKSISGAIQTGNFYPKRENGVIKPVWEIEPNGRWQIFKHPDKTLKNKIVGGLDSYKLGSAVDSDSKGAIEFYVPFQGVNIAGDYPAAVYWERPKDKEVFYMDAMLGAMYYDTQILVELTEEDIVMWFKTHNGLKYLKERPSIIKTAYSKAENKYGVLPTAQNKGMALEYSIKLFNANYDQIVFVELLREMIKFSPDVNTDRVDAHNWAVLHAMDNMKVLDEFKKPVKEKRFVPFTATDNSGKLVVVNSQEQARNLGLLPNENENVILHERLKRYESKFQ